MPKTRAFLRWGLLGAAILLSGTAIRAQTTTQVTPPRLGGPAAENHPNDPEYSPRALPGDRLPPFGMLNADGRVTAEPPPRTTPRTPRRESSVPSLPLDIALEGALAAVRECAGIGDFGGVAVVDSAGEIRAALSVDGADGSHVFVAVRKALVPLAFGTPGGDARRAVDGDPALTARVTPNMFVRFGSFPITSNGQIVGAIGYSGGDDVRCAEAGWRVIQGRLPQ